MSTPPRSGGGSVFKRRRARSSNHYNEDDFDFAVILNPSADYESVAGLLDFTSETGLVDDPTHHRTHGDSESFKLGPGVALDGRGQKQFLYHRSVFEEAAGQAGDSRTILGERSEQTARGFSSPPLYFSSPPVYTHSQEDDENTHSNIKPPARSKIEMLRERKRNAELKLPVGGNGEKEGEKQTSVPRGLASRHNSLDDFLRAMQVSTLTAAVAVEKI